MAKRNKKTHPNKIKNELYITYTSYASGGEICEGQEDDEWPCYEDAEIEFSITSCYMSDENIDWYETINIDFNPKPNQNVFIVTVRYSTGDTFSRTNGQWEIITATQTEQEARQLQEQIENDEYESEYGYLPWEGYFEYLQRIEITPISVKEK